MRYAVIYQSRSGNTRKIAKEIYESLQTDDKELRDLDEISEFPKADVYLLGFGIRNGSCGIDIIECLEHITGKCFVLFATCGLLATDGYRDILERRLSVWMPEGVRYLGMFLCQGRTEQTQQAIMKEQNSNIAHMLDNIFSVGNTHPDESDLLDAAHFAEMVQLHMEYGVKLPIW